MGREGMMKKRPIIFCDFDGTITEKDNIVATIAHFNPPGWQPIVDDIIGGHKSIRQGVGELFSLLPSSKKEEVISYSVGNAVIRAGFQELLQYAKEHEIHFLVTSGGIDFFIHRLLAPFPIDPEDVFCNTADFSGEHIHIDWPHPCDDVCPNQGCGMCKTTIIRQYPAEQYIRILIGDSVTDFEGAKLADIVFARSHLITRCEEISVPYYPFETFHDVVRQLEDLLPAKQMEESNHP
jgi:2-hydroxy-3-keto-5-methylthiopentenyl-1-phosphate phosphatase